MDQRRGGLLFHRDLNAAVSVTLFGRSLFWA
jgi:hypothetical protein